MMSLLIGMPAINAEFINQVNPHQSLTSVDAKVKALGTSLHSSISRNQPKTSRERSFSPLKFLWWASLLMGARAQQTTPFPASMNLSSLAGTSGFVLNGKMANDYSGSVASAGDLNGDGIADLLIGAVGANSLAGKSYVIFGRAGLGSIGSLPLSSLNGTNGFVLNGDQAHDASGYSVASAGDVNGDGIADLVIGASGAAPSGKVQAGKSYVVFGKVGLAGNGSLELSSLNGTSGFVLNGDKANDYSGWSVASAGDVNGDQIADLLIGAYAANSGAGKSYVVFGRVGLGSTGSLALSSLNGTNGFVLNGEQANDDSGDSVASAGDLNGDGIADLVIGAFAANSKAGKSYVVFGRVGLGAKGTIALSSLNGTNGFVLNGEQANDQSGAAARAGDVNGDGIADLLIGAINANSYAGKSYVVFGRVGLGGNGSLELSSLNGTNGFVLNGEQANDFSGSSVASAGDLNRDGIADLVIGAPNATAGAGKSYVVFGKAGLGSTGSLALSSLNGTNGFVLNGEATNDDSGWSVASAGDVNGDQIADLMIGAPYANSNAGKIYVVFGRKLSNATFLTTLTSTSRSITSTLSTSAQSTPLTLPLTTALVPSTTTLKLTALTTTSFQFIPVGQPGSSSTLTAPLTTGSNPLTSSSISTPLDSTLGPTNVVGPNTFPSGISTSALFAPSSTMMSPSSQATTSSPVGFKSSATNVPIIAGISGGAGALTLSIVAGVVAFLRIRSKNKNENLEEANSLPRLQVNENAKGETAKPDGQIYAGFGKVNQAEYSSARFHQQEAHYEDPNNFAKELQNNPPQANYVDVNSLEVLNGKNSGISRAGYDEIPAPIQAGGPHSNPTQANT